MQSTKKPKKVTEKTTPPSNGEVVAPSPNGHIEPWKPSLKRISTVLPEAVEWLWEPYLPRKMVVSLDGDPGTGKSTLLLDIAARVTQGSAMPLDPTGNGTGQGAAVLLLAAEDDAAASIRPRLDAAGAETQHIIMMEGFTRAKGSPKVRGLSLPKDIEVLHGIITKNAIQLVIIDPLFAFVGDVDTHKDSDVRKVTTPLSALARETGCCIIILRHIAKERGRKAIHAGGGSGAWTAAARIALTVGEDPTNKARFILAVAKTNLARKPPSIAYSMIEQTIGNGITINKIAWMEQTNVGADDLNQADDDGMKEGKKGKEVAHAAAFLGSLLRDGPVESCVVKAEARTAGIAERTLNRAKALLGISSIKEGSASYWNLK